MESLLISKVSKATKGFTLIEIVLVVALVGLIASASVIYSLPALTGFACEQEVRAAEIALERARFLAQFAKKGDMQLSVNVDGYEIKTAHDSESVLLDQFVHQTPIPVTPSGDIVFEQGSGSLFGGKGGMEIDVGNSTSSCHRVIQINNAGAIL